MELKDILRNREAGAAALLKRALGWLRANPDALAGGRRACTLRTLREGRPAMAGFASLARRLEEILGRQPQAPVPEVLERLASEIDATEFLLAEQCRELLQSRAPVRIVTLSRSSSVLMGLRQGRDSLAGVNVLESHPGGEGRGLAKEVATFVRRTQLYRDERIADAVDGADLGLVGADRVFANGDVLNKVLSRSLAEECRRENKPFYVLCSSWKFSRQQGEEWRLEADDAGMFEVVPATLISGVLTETGMRTSGD